MPFNAEYSDDIMAELYEADDARAKTFAAFTLLAVIVACLGLFGLAAFTAERRTKEIGIRKVLGARTRDIVRLLVWQFSKPIIIANLIAWPVAWWVMRDWLNNFDARIDLGVDPVPARRRARSGDRDRDRRRPRASHLARQSDPRAPLRMRSRGTKDVAQLSYGRFPGADPEPDLRLHQHFRPGPRPRRLPDADPLRPLRDQLRQLAAGQ